MTVIYITVGLFTIVGLGFLLFPLRDEEAEFITEGGNDDTSDTIEATRNALKDLELEFQIGKISGKEYKSLKHEMLAEWAAAEKDLPPVEERKEEPVSSRVDNNCPACGAIILNLESARFCSHCGRPLNRAYA